MLQLLFVYLFTFLFCHLLWFAYSALLFCCFCALFTHKLEAENAINDICCCCVCCCLENFRYALADITSHSPHFRVPLSASLFRTVAKQNAPVGCFFFFFCFCFETETKLEPQQQQRAPVYPRLHVVCDWKPTLKSNTGQPSYRHTETEAAAGAWSVRTQLS